MLLWHLAGCCFSTLPLLDAAAREAVGTPFAAGNHLERKQGTAHPTGKQHEGLPGFGSLTNQPAARSSSTQQHTFEQLEGDSRTHSAQPTTAWRFWRRFMQLLCPCSCYCVFCADTCYGGSQVRAQSALAGLLCGSVCSLLGACLDVFAGIAGSAWLKVQTYRGGVQPLWSLPWCFWRDSCWGPASASAAAAPLWAAAAQSGGWGLVGTDSHLSSILAFSTDLQAARLGCSGLLQSL